MVNQTEGILLSTEIEAGHREKAYQVLKSDAHKILKLIEVQMDNLTMPQCPLYEEVLDTQMFGLSREIDFAIRLGLVEEKDAKELLESLERQLSTLHDAVTREK
ncbi:YlaN family protein [Pullulanibacillus pueri]|uniref:YlaN family protein n=1 Tax=Pullulanibacillus pueri TaxID=1437324 RepID=UPI00357127FA